MATPQLKIHILNSDYDKAHEYLNTLSRDDLFDNLLYSGLGVVGNYGTWIENASDRLYAACGAGSLDHLPDLND